MDNTFQARDYENLYQMCLQFSHHLILVLSKTLHILDINPQASKILKWPKELAHMQSIHDLFESTDIKPFLDTFPPTEKQKKTTYISYKNHNLKIIWTITPFFENGSEFIGIFGKLAPGLTDKELRMQLENVVKYAPGLFYWKDINSVYQGSNAEFARLAGLESWMHVKGKTDFEIAWKDRAEEYVEIDRQVMQTGQANLNREEIIMTSDKKAIIAVTNKVPLFDRKNRVIGLMGITTDITHQKEVERHLKLAKEQAEIANRAKSEFIANMSHDIRTPLSGVVGMSQLLKERLVDSEEKQYAQWIYDCGEQLLDLLNGILEVVSADNVSETDLHLETFNLQECIEEIIQIGRPSTQLKGIALTLHFGKDVPAYIVSDRTKLHRILLNLLGNAIKFTEEGSVHIDVQLLHRDGKEVTIQFQVIDTGIGIPTEFQDKVFDRFFRASPSYKGMYEGHGVGLHIAESYVSLLGGKINLSSVLGQGTTFYFNLNFQLGESEEVAVYEQDNAFLYAKIKATETSLTHFSHNPPELKSTPMVLLVEDNTIARKVMECLMSDLKIRYTSCQDAESALTLLKSEEYDLLITDIGLPGISGNELTMRVRAWEEANRRHPMPIIGLTAHVQGRIQAECVKAGMSHVYSKPMNLDTLQAIQRTYLNRSRPADYQQSEAHHSLLYIPLLDLTHLMRNLNQDLQLLRDILHSMAHHELPQHVALLEMAYSAKDHSDFKDLLHKIKGGAMYCATLRLQHICQYLENALALSYAPKQIETLYHTLIQVAEDTQHAIIEVLKD